MSPTLLPIMMGSSYSPLPSVFPHMRQSSNGLPSSILIPPLFLYTCTETNLRIHDLTEIVCFVNGYLASEWHTCVVICTYRLLEVLMVQEKCISLHHPSLLCRGNWGSSRGLAVVDTRVDTRYKGGCKGGCGCKMWIQRWMWRAILTMCFQTEAYSHYTKHSAINKNDDRN